MRRENDTKLKKLTFDLNLLLAPTRAHQVSLATEANRYNTDRHGKLQQGMSVTCQLSRIFLDMENPCRT